MSTVHYTLPDDACIIPAYPDYAITPNGILFSHRDGVRGNPRRKSNFWRQLAPAKKDSGYPVASLTNAAGQRKSVCLHALILTTFVGPRPVGMIARHLNGKRTDCRLVNLVWGTPKENQDDRRRHGTMTYGDRQPETVLTVLRVEAILALRSLGWGSRKLAELFGVDRRTITFACDGSTWEHLCSEKQKRYEEKKANKPTRMSITPEMLLIIEQRLDDGETQAAIARDLGVTTAAISWRRKCGDLKPRTTMP